MGKRFDRGDFLAFAAGVEGQAFPDALPRLVTLSDIPALLTLANQ
jgi:hypothetical protein